MRNDGERDRWEIAAPAAAKSAAARHPRGPTRPLQNGACANNDLAPRVRGQSKPIKTMAYEPIFTPKIGRFASKFMALWAIWFRIFNSRLCAKWGPSVAGRRLIVSETPYSGLLGQSSSTGLAGQHAAHRLVSTHSG